MENKDDLRFSESGTTPAGEVSVAETVCDRSEAEESSVPDGRTGKNQTLLFGYLRLMIRLVIIALAGLFIFTRVFLIMQASGNEMFPSIKDGDLVLAFRMQKDYNKNDAVVYSFDGETYIARIAAFEGDVVILDENGILYVNGTEQNGEILYPTYAKEGITYPYKIPEGCVFLLDDYRSVAHDSRERGAVQLENVKGKIITILRRRGL